MGFILMITCTNFKEIQMGSWKYQMSKIWIDMNTGLFIANFWLVQESDGLNIELVKYSNGGSASICLIFKI